MSTSDITKIITTLLTAPAEAVVNAATEQRRIWISWLQDIQRLINDAADDAQKKKIIDEHMKLAPLWKMGAQVSIGITMRVASIERSQSSASLGLGIGLLQASGSFGFMQESTNESILQARAQYVLSNDTEITLSDYLSDLGVTLSSAADVQSAVEKLGVAATPLAQDK